MSELRLESFPFDSNFAGYDEEGYPVYDRAVGASMLRQAYRQFFRTGVFGDDAGAFWVEAAPGLNVMVGAGMAIVDGAIGGIAGDPVAISLLDEAPKGNVAVGVYLRCDDNDEFRSMYLVTRASEAMADPQPPEPASEANVSELRLGWVLVPSGAAEASECEVHNEKGLEVCPFASPLLEIDLSRIIGDAQREAEEANEDFYRFLLDNMAMLQAALDGTAAGYLQGQIDALRADSITSDGLDPRNFEIASDTPTGEPVLRISEGFVDGELARIDSETRRLILDAQALRKAMGLGDTLGPLEQGFGGTGADSLQRGISGEGIRIEKYDGVANSAYSLKTTLAELDDSGALFVGSHAFDTCNSLSKVSLAKCLEIGTYAFTSCTSLSDIRAPMCETIGTFAFNSCSSLTRIEAHMFPACKTLGANAFQGIPELEYVEMPACETFDRFALSSTSASMTFVKNVSAVSFPAAVSVPELAFAGFISLESANLRACLYLGSRAFAYCSSLRTVELDSCSVIGDYAFSNCSSLESVDLPACESVMTGAFMRCGLASIRLPNLTRFVGAHAFSDCTRMSLAYMPNLAAPLGASAFRGCATLSKANIGGCTVIQSSAFSGCVLLDELVIPGSSIAALSEAAAFYSTPLRNGTGTIYVPASLVSGYQAATNWTAFSSLFSAIEDAPEGVLV